MPNHETNHVVIVGTEEKVKALREAVIKETGEDSHNSHHFDFEAIVPSPAGKETGGCNGDHAPGVVCWYQWNIENWGTKWGSYDLNYEGIVEQPHADGHLLYVIFETAWSAPTPVFAAMEEKFDVKVHAWTEDEGGFPPQIYGEPDLYLDIETTHLVWEDGAEDERPATQDEIASGECYARWEVELRD
jgi:hypothetical protein